MNTLLKIAVVAVAVGATPIEASAGGGYWIAEHRYTYVEYGPWFNKPFFYATPLYNQPAPPYYRYYPYVRRHSWHAKSYDRGHRHWRRSVRHRRHHRACGC